MHRTDAIGNNAGQFVDKDPQTGTPGTLLAAKWFNAVQEELAYVIEQEGIVLSDADNTQLRQALVKMITAAQRSVIISGATFEGTVANGDAVRWDQANSRFAKAIADGTEANRAVGFADVANGKVYAQGEAPGLFAGLTPGSRYFLSAAVAGAITNVQPLNDIVIVGIAKSADTLFVDIDHIPTTATFKTGDVKASFRNVADAGWVLMDDGSIGSAASGATTRANEDTRDLYRLLWQNVTDTWAPVAGGRGADADSDFDANKAMTLPKALGRTLAAAGAGAGLTARALGQVLGEEAHALTAAENGPHNHGGSTNTTGEHTHPPASGFSDFRGQQPGGAYHSGPSATDEGFFTQTGSAGNHAHTIPSDGSGTPHNNMQPTLFLHFHVKL